MKNLILFTIFSLVYFNIQGQEKYDCLEWDYYKTECLSNIPDGSGSSKAGIKRTVCKISETNSTITVEAVIEPVNGGIDSRLKFYKGLKYHFRGDKDYTYLSKEEFNKGGAIKRIIELNKSELKGPYLKALESWNKWTHMLFVTVECVNN